ncbi:MAG: S-layer homology domain-containing protein [Acidobacteriia bacterium]|nr:S-layer homology domain-containing protein [Terriglobia bacterium]
MKRVMSVLFLTLLISMVSMVESMMAQNAIQVPNTALQSTAQAISPTRPDPPQTYGGLQVSYYMVPAMAFFPSSTTQPNNSTYSTDDRGMRWVTGGGSGLYAPIYLPSGAKIIYMELDYIDNSTLGQVSASLTKCDWTGVSCSFHPTTNPACSQGFICSTVPEASPNIGVVSIDLSAENLVVDNYTTRFIIFASPSLLDGSEKFGGVIIGYVLQVSAPPLAASFDDVPTTHPWFQWIEALKASGLTAGCSANPPLFCPDAPVTRGQMAIFLSRGLGLQWH